MRNFSLKEWVKGTLLISAALTLPFVTTAQVHSYQNNPERANIWYFGDHAGLDFSGGAPVALTNGAMQSFEGVSTMCDNFGNLLFYTNGGDFPYQGGVWNRNNQLMPNGVMTGRGGCNSSAQSSLILPQPRSSSVFYLFTTDCMENSAAGGLRYNIVDMNADGGLGDVVSANNRLVAPTDESLTAIQHINQQDYWVITHKYHTDSFYAYHLSPLGIIGVVKTKTGLVTPDYAGTLKASVNGQKLVYSGLNWTMLFDFNTETGVISHPVNLNRASYTAAFSSDCHYLYLANGASKSIYQYDMLASDIAASGVLVGSTSSTGIGGMTLGPDEKIYVSRFVSSQYLGVINSPNEAGSLCNYVDNGVFLNGKNCKGSLPNFANNLLGGCTDYPDENVSNYVANLHHISIDYYNSHHVAINWVDFSGQPVYRVLHREVGTTTWSQTLVNDHQAVLEDLKSNTNYEIRVIPMVTGNPDYEPLTDHLFDDDMAAAKTSASTSLSDDVVFAKTAQDIDFDLYPNPSKGTTNIALNLGDETSNVDVKILDMQGRVVNQMNVNDVSGYNRYQIPTDQLSDGIYNVQVATASSSNIKKLVIVR